MASREPVDAPDGTAARPITPLSSRTSHSTVGLPRLSRISRPTMSTMALIQVLSESSNSCCVFCAQRRDCTRCDAKSAMSAGEVILEQRLRLHDTVERGELFE